MVKDNLGKEIRSGDWVVCGKHWWEVAFVINVVESEQDINHRINDGQRGEPKIMYGGGDIQIISIYRWNPYDISYNKRWIRSKNLCNCMKITEDCIPENIRKRVIEKIDKKLGLLV